LRGRGLPRLNSTGAGDLHIRVQLWTPATLSAEEEALVRKLGEMQVAAPDSSSKGFWSKMKEALGA
jgi:molecular chaperone DnaJ